MIRISSSQIEKFKEKIEKGKKLEKMASTEGWNLLIDFFQSIQKNCYENFLNSKTGEGSETLKAEARTIQKITNMVHSTIAEGKWCQEKLTQLQNYIPKERSQV